MALYKTYDKVLTITSVRNKIMPTWNAYNSLISKELEPNMIQFLLFPVGSCVFKVNNRNTKTRYGICSNLTIKTPIVNFEQVNAG